MQEIKTTVVLPFIIKTPMNSEYQIAPSKLTPLLEADEVSQAIFNAILYRNKDEILIPAFLHSFTFIRVFPSWIYDWIVMVELVF